MTMICNKYVKTFFCLTNLVCAISAYGMDSAAGGIAYDEPCSIKSDNLDDLILQGIKHISEHGERFEARAGSGQQAYDVSYTLLNPTRRLHFLRSPKSIKYFCRELLAYFKGSLKVNEGLAQASAFWKTLADSKGEISSNYGYYVFHQRIPEAGDITQYEWVIQCFLKNLDTRKAFININQPRHKVADSKDFPCTIGMQFFIKRNCLCCVVSSRSTDIFTGLPYDMGFFAFVTELVYKDLKERLPHNLAEKLKLGYVTMKTSFTQIYDKTHDAALALLTAGPIDPALSDNMPLIENAHDTLQDIYSQTSIVKWIHKYA
jgi:thymidylate synthase